MKKVLVTGADGFIGSHLVELLLIEGFDVKAFCLYNSFGSYGWIDNLSKEIKSNIEVHLGDIRDYESILEAVKGCDYIFHLASLIAIPYSYKAPKSYVETNINGTLNVLNAAKACNVQKFIHTSTSETYGTAQYVPINENHPLVGQSPYAATKIGADQLALSYWRSFSTPVTVLRPFNTYGPRQSDRAVIPTIISQIALGKNRISLGSITPTRDFNYVLDTCNAFLEVVKSDLTIGKTINVASKFEISIGETALLISRIMDKEVEIYCDEERLRPDNSEVERLYGDNTLIKKITNWNPEFAGLEGFKKGLKLTIDWFNYSDNLRFYRPNKYNV